MLKIINFCVDFCYNISYNNNVLNKGGDNLGTKMGRPTDNPKIFQTRIRLTKDELEMLEDCVKSLSMTKTDVIISGIKEVYKRIKK